MAEITRRKRIWGWYFFDWASQPYNTLLLTFIFGPYFAQTATNALVDDGMDLSAAKAQAQAYWGYGLALAGIAIAILAPILGAVADSSGRRMPWIWIFSVMYVVGAAALWWTCLLYPSEVADAALGVTLVSSLIMQNKNNMNDMNHTAKSETCKQL